MKKYRRFLPNQVCSLPKVLVGLMFGSDGTHLTSFGDSSLVALLYVLWERIEISQMQAPV